MLQFRRYSKQWYWKTRLPKDNDDILIGDYLKDGSCRWEFKIVEVMLQNKNTLQIQIFNDAVRSLGNSRIIKALQEVGQINRLDEVEVVLKRNRMKEAFDAKKDFFV